jgi:class 3 adenylate cyclase/dienelactone hydrolase
MAHSRHLAAIMFADIMGFTAIMEQDEELAMSLREKLKNKLMAEVSLHNGKVLKFSGDGALCIFDSAIESIQAAIEVQKNMQQEPKVALRVGIHQADIIFEDSDVHGDGVNIASRLESLAIPGSILISGKVYDDLKNHKEIQAISLGKYSLKNVKEPVEIYAISNVGLAVPRKIKLDGKGVKYKEHTSTKRLKAAFAWMILSVATLGILGYLFVLPWIKREKLHNKLIPEIEKLANASFFPPSRAFDLAVEAEKYDPNDSELIKLWPIVSDSLSFKTNPSGADIFWKDYNDENGEWKLIGRTPLQNARMPKGFPKMKIEKEGFQTVYSPNLWFTNSIKLDRTGNIPNNMVKVNGSKSLMLIVGLEQYEDQFVGDFLMDIFEVTNKEFKRFVDAGGYRDKMYWSYPVFSDGKEISWEQAMKLFHDKAERPGPADWEVGNYPPGKDRDPVTGISWYEAMAYAKFVHKTLPTVYQWSQVANTWSTWEIIPRSNFNGKGTVPVGSLGGISWWGVYDIAGNVKEWCLNESEKPGHRYILGGGWDDPTYSFNDGREQSAINRSLSNGFRCVQQLPRDTSYNNQTGILKFAFRDYKTEKPVNHDQFNIFLRQYAYDPTPLNPVISIVEDKEQYKIEKIVIDAAYNKEKIFAFLYLPKNSAPPFQTIVIFPGSGAIQTRTSDNHMDLISWGSGGDFLLNSGRAVLFPILKGTYERGDELRSDLQEQTIFYKNHVIAWIQDISRALDYLDTRNDIIHDRFGYFGLSWGGAMSPVVCAIEKRFKAAVLHSGGLMMQKTYTEVDPINFLPFVQIPVLMLNGKNDTFFPVETSQKPMFTFLGSRDNEKKIIFYEGGHAVPRSELIKESLSWFDKYLGPVN